MTQHNSKEVLDRIYKENFVVLEDSKGIPLNVSFTEDGLKWTYDSKGRNMYYRSDTRVRPFRPDPKVLNELSFLSKCTKRWIDKANALLYLQRLN